jgi:hypothetical protein
MDAIIHAEFGAEATARKLALRERMAANPALALTRACAMIGPDRLPPEAFTREAWGLPA